MCPSRHVNSDERFGIVSTGSRGRSPAGERTNCFLLVTLSIVTPNKDSSTLPNIHNALSSKFTASGFLQDVADVTVKEGSDKGLALLKQRLEPLISIAPENYIMAVVVDQQCWPVNSPF